MAEIELSRRQAAVCDGLLAGKQYKEIAAELGLTPKTIETHARLMYKKLKVTGKQALWAKLQGMHSPDRMAKLEARVARLEALYDGNGH